jgi:acetoin utilization protein AcuC
MDVRVALAYDDSLAAYRFNDTHPLRPERFTLAVELMRAWGLLEPPDVAIVPPPLAPDGEVLLAHSADYVAAVKDASTTGRAQPGFGIGPGDTPAFLGMHEAAARAAGATCEALDAVLDGRSARAHSPAGGLHHAHHDHASGFCIYNDAVIAIERAIRARPGLRVAYVDIDAHHGDGVEAAFIERPDVLTLSVHESGTYLFPGTGRATDAGKGAGAGTCINVPLPPYAGDECYPLVLEQVIAPALRGYAPDVIVLQAGGDTHRSDPLTHLDLTVAGYVSLVSGIIALAEEVCSGRIVALGGGGYQPFSEVPRMWAAVMALLLGRDVPEVLPEAWLERAAAGARMAGQPAPASAGTFDEPDIGPGDAARAEARAGTEQAIRTVLSNVSL